MYGAPLEFRQFHREHSEKSNRAAAATAAQSLPRLGDADEAKPPSNSTTAGG
jgi:hypothetical protein